MSFCGGTLRLQQTLSTIFPRSIRSSSLTSSSSPSFIPTHLSSSLLVSSIVRNPTSAAFMSSAAVSSSSSASSTSAGLRFREVILSSHSSTHPSLSTPSRPVAVLGTVNAYSALLAEQAGAKAIYLSGSGVATASHGLPDLGITDLHDVCEDAKRITAITKLPLLVDIDTGFGSAFNIARTIQELERVGVAAIHIEDQVQAKRCGHRPNKAIVPLDEMVDRIRAAVAARRDPNFVIMARTDALANEGLEKAIERAKAYIAAGADMLFPEACYTLEDYAAFRKALPQIPILANITEFGQTPLFTVEELGSVGVSMVLYPLSAFRAMSLAAQRVYESILKDGTQKNVLPLMQTRKDLYTAINYHSYENKLDALFGKEKEKEPKGKL